MSNGCGYQPKENKNFDRNKPPQGGSGATRLVKKWEYYVLVLCDRPDCTVEEELNKKGQEGWELVSVDRTASLFGYDSRFYLKRAFLG